MKGVIGVMPKDEGGEKGRRGRKKKKGRMRGLKGK